MNRAEWSRFSLPMDRQRFPFPLENGAVRAKAGAGCCAKTDLGVAKDHLEAAAGTENVRWA